MIFLRVWFCHGNLSVVCHFKKVLIQYLLCVHVVVMMTLATQYGCQPRDVPAVHLENPHSLETSIVNNSSETLSECILIMHSDL